MKVEVNIFVFVTSPFQSGHRTSVASSFFPVATGTSRASFVTRKRARVSIGPT